MNAKRDWSDLLNPVLVKEIRQYFHNKMLHGLTWLLLGGQLVVLLMMQSIIRPNHVSSDAAIIMYIVTTVCIVLCGLLICGIMGETRFAAERADQEMDFTRITPLNPSRIILGKMIGALVMACYLYALCLPFMVTAYFLRGIEMGQMLLGAAIAFPIILLVAQLGLLFGAFGRKWTIWIYGATVFWLLFSYLVGKTLVMRFGGMAGSWALGFVFQILLALLVIGFLFASTVALINHPAANRMLAVRIYLVGILLAGPFFGLLVHWIARTGRWQEAFFWGALTCGGMAISCCATLAAFERDRAGWRVTRHCPRSWWGRRGYFLLSSGWGGGILLAWVMLLIQGVSVFLMRNMVRSADPRIFAAIMMSAFSPVYYIAVAEAAILLHRRIPRLKNWQWWLVIQCVCFFFGLFYGISNSRSSNLFRILFSSHSTPAMNDFMAVIGPILYSGIAALGLVLLFRHIRRQFMDFRRDALPGNVSPPPVVPVSKPKPAPVSASEPVPMPKIASLPSYLAAGAGVGAAVPVGSMPATSVSFGKAGDGWNCWTLNCLRQLRHNRYLLIIGLGSVLVQLFLLYLHTQLPKREIPAVITTLLLTAGAGTIACLSQVFTRNKTMTRKESPMLHRLNYSPFPGGALMWGLIQSHAILFCFFLLLGTFSLIYCLVSYPEGIVGLFLRGGYVYLISLSFILLFSTLRIRLDSLFCWIILCLLFTMNDYFWKWDVSGLVTSLLMTLYLMEWFRANQLSPSAERELRLRIGQVVLMGAGVTMLYVERGGSMMVVLMIGIGALGAIGSMGGYFDGVGGRRHSKRARALWSDASSWGWLWAWAASILAFFMLLDTDYKYWNTVIVTALCGGEVGFILANTGGLQIRRWNIDSREKVYAFLSIAVTAAILLGIMLVALFGVLDLEKIWEDWSYYGWWAAALLFLFIIPCLIADLKNALPKWSATE